MPRRRTQPNGAERSHPPAAAPSATTVAIRRVSWTSTPTSFEYLQRRYGRSCGPVRGPRSSPADEWPMSAEDLAARTADSLTPSLLRVITDDTDDLTASEKRAPHRST